jgi:CheY-like chemotaxis protein
MDNTQLEQVLLNLFFNSSYAMSNCGTIRVRCENAEPTLAQTKPDLAGGGDFVKLTVADDGVGMDEATMARMFDPFFTTKPAGLGSGLGLASVYGIVKNHGGTIEVKSNPGKGTTFTLFLPATTRPAKTPSKAMAPGTHRAQGTVLMVDDEPMILSVYTALLAAMGYEVLAANGGHAAIELLRQHVGKVSLIILDLTMPGMSGAETYDAIRQLDPHVKVLLASGFALEGQAQELLTRGCNGFIQKPFSRAALVEKIESLH